MQPPGLLVKAWKLLGHISLAQWLWYLGSPALFGGLTWLSDQPFWLVAFISFGAFAIALIAEPRAASLRLRLFGPKVIISDLSVIRDEPKIGSAALRLIVVNKGKSDIRDLKAELVSACPPLNRNHHNSNSQAPTLPLTLATKTRLDALRNNGEPLPHQRFRLGPYEKKQIEVAWLRADEAMEANTTHEGGEAEYLFWFDQCLEIEISGLEKPLYARVLLEKTNEENGAWEARLMDIRDPLPQENAYGPWQADDH